MLFAFSLKQWSPAFGRVTIYCGSLSKTEAIVGCENISFCPFIPFISRKLIPTIQLLNEVAVSFH